MAFRAAIRSVGSLWIHRIVALRSALYLPSLALNCAANTFRIVNCGPKSGTIFRRRIRTLGPHLFTLGIAEIRQLDAVAIGVGGIWSSSLRSRHRSSELLRP